MLRQNGPRLFAPTTKRPLALVVATAVLFPFRMLISCLCADVLAAIQSCWNAWLVRMLLISLSAKPARPLLSGRARIAAARGSVLAAQRRRSP